MDISTKLLRHADHIKGILNGHFLPPIMVDIDPVDGSCNLDCAWCCQAASRASRPARFMAADTMTRLGSFSNAWGVKAWRISGDSEPLLNKGIDALIRSGSANGIEMGLITNGVYLERITEPNLLTWIGVSLDATSAKTWADLKKSPPANFDKIITNIKRLKDNYPDLDLSIKFLRWAKDINLSMNEFTNLLPQLDAPTCQPDNYEDAEALPEFAKALGCNWILKDSYPKDFPKQYRFDVCRATPLGGVFDASHHFHLCCDARSIFVLTDDYTRDDWQEVPRLWGSDKHKELIAKINPTKCMGCAKNKMNDVLENVVLEGKHTKGYQLNFI